MPTKSKPSKRMGKAHSQQRGVSQPVWIVGKTLDWKVSAWEFQGVYDSEDAAEKACKTKDYFIGPAIVNEKISHRRVMWEGARYPKAG